MQPFYCYRKANGLISYLILFFGITPEVRGSGSNVFFFEITLLLAAYKLCFIIVIQ